MANALPNLPVELHRAWEANPTAGQSVRPRHAKMGWPEWYFDKVGVITSVLHMKPGSDNYVVAVQWPRERPEHVFDIKIVDTYWLDPAEGGVLAMLPPPPDEEDES